MNTLEISQKSNNIRKQILEMIYKSGASHIGSCYSIVDLLAVLYFDTLNIDPKDPENPNRDIFLLSKGHAGAAWYATLAEAEFFKPELLDAFCQNGTRIIGHIIKGCLPGVECTAGSLGHGLPIANGLSLARKNSKQFVYCLVGDGECNEGSIWEAAMFASQNKLKNLVLIVDINGQQGLGDTENIINNEKMNEKFAAFGWEVKEVDGHNIDEIKSAFDYFKIKNDPRPSVLLAHTIKGKGVSFMEDKIEWHYRNPKEEEYKKALEELNAKI